MIIAKNFIFSVLLCFAVTSCIAQSEDCSPERLQALKDSLHTLQQVAAQNAHARQKLSTEIESLEAKLQAGKFDYGKNISSLIQHTTNLPWRMTFQGKSYDIYVVDISANQLRLYQDDEKGVKYDFAKIDAELKTKNQHLLFAMNGGMYTPDKKPQGLYVENTEQIQKADFKKEGYGNFYMAPNGIFLIDNTNKAHVIQTDSIRNFSKGSVKWATQSGPMLLIDGKIHHRFNQGSPNLNIRNGVGVISPNKIVFAISNEEVNFYEFSELFRDVFGCKNALYLDGVVSRAYIPELKRINDLNSSKHLGGPIITIIR